MPVSMSAGRSWISAGFGSDDWDAAANRLNYALSGETEDLDYSFNFGVEVRLNTSGVISTKPAAAALSEIADTVGSVIGEIEREMVRILAIGSDTAV